MRDRQRDTEMEGGGYGENSVYLDFFFLIYWKIHLIPKSARSFFFLSFFFFSIWSKHGAEQMDAETNIQCWTWTIITFFTVWFIAQLKANPPSFCLCTETLSERCPDDQLVFILTKCMSHQSMSHKGISFFLFVSKGL